eukprot:CAMPEP_0196133324 /NCGR_PEP_ID=MMETSP0910-20130528/2592_1 /TAXON_ID=49265 /ORGANISM="Thalassiosira rotula, Strain GSO102" /LENGTH=590 /DNA_ID=CAMNT_0041393037 /DNA_START=146 /DNA_END=1918 /DNA_ORIENTATION=+
MAANSLREKRRVGGSSNSNSGGVNGSNSRQDSTDQNDDNIAVVKNSNNEDDDASASDKLEISMTESQANGTSNRSNVYSFFDPADIRTSPASSPMSTGRRQQQQPFDEPGGGANVVAPSGGSGGGGDTGDAGDAGVGGGDDASSRSSSGSAATERIANHKSIDAAFVMNDTSAVVAASAIRPSSSTWVMEDKEVKYEEGATEMFMLVEDAKWEEVCDRVEEEPAESRVWVVSSGTENTVFSWSVWRRLPLHEACRRQPPPVVIYALLSAYPESSMAESNFGELPLHAAVRCGACAEVVNCIIASYPAAALARDNSGCTPLDILNGTGKMMDHDAVVAALNRTIAVLTKEEQAWEHKISSMQLDFKQNKEKRRREYERIVANKNAEIEDLKRTLDQEKLATSNLASKVIQTEQVVQEKNKQERRLQEWINQMKEEIRELKGSNSSRKSKIKDLEDIVRSDRKTIMELNNRVQTLQSSLTSLLEDEETFAATKLAKAEMNFKTLMESQFIFLRETERRKDLIRSRVKQLGIKIPPKKKMNGDENDEEKRRRVQKQQPPPPVEEVSNNEVAEKALASAMAHLNPFEDHDERDF